MLRLRSENKTASILMISNEPYRTYNRPMLTKSIMADLDEEQIAVQNAGWYEEQNIQQVLDMEVVAIHPETKEIELEGGLKFVYTKLIHYALGSECFIPPIAGAGKEGVIAIRRLDDTKKVAAMLPDVGMLLLIGGGVLGLEAVLGIEEGRLSGDGSGSGLSVDGTSA